MSRLSTSMRRASSSSRSTREKYSGVSDKREASVALLTIYDMAKAIDKGMVISEVRLIAKTGGKSGDWHAPETNGA